MLWHRPLTPEDVATAHRILELHEPMTVHRGELEKTYCGNALHWGALPIWPCMRVRWAEEVLAAETRGEVVGESPI